MSTHIIWFRQDLRLTDNPALFAASRGENKLIAIYIFDTTLSKKKQIGGAQKWWLHHSLIALKAQLAKQHCQLILRKGDPKKIILKLCQETKASAVYWNMCYEPWALKRDKKIQTVLNKNNILVKVFNGSLLFSPWQIKNNSGQYFKVFTPFWKKCLTKLKFLAPLPIPKINSSKHKLTSDILNDWHLLPKKPNWAMQFTEYWQPGEQGAHQKLKIFLQKKLKNYAAERDCPDLAMTSMLSPHLHFGEITPQQILFALKNLSISTHHKEKFVAELGWREFSYHLLYHFPKLSEKPFKEKFAKFKWQKNLRQLKAWQQGKTGYPIVDAGMRQLWQIGWMHNRVRMLVASFLIKDLFLAWHTGEAWFWDTLVDADLANNSASWQWVAGSGADAMPYFRIFNPTTQAKKFDPEGNYVKRWLPELQKLPKKFIHEPWLAPVEILTAAKIQLGKTYPLPIVNHEKSRKKALKIYKTL